MILHIESNFSNLFRVQTKIEIGRYFRIFTYFILHILAQKRRPTFEAQPPLISCELRKHCEYRNIKLFCWAGKQGILSQKKTFNHFHANLMEKSGPQSYLKCTRFHTAQHRTSCQNLESYLKYINMFRSKNVEKSCCQKWFLKTKARKKLRHFPTSF